MQKSEFKILSRKHSLLLPRPHHPPGLAWPVPTLQEALAFTLESTKVPRERTPVTDDTGEQTQCRKESEGEGKEAEQEPKEVKKQEGKSKERNIRERDES